MSPTLRSSRFQSKQKDAGPSAETPDTYEDEVLAALGGTSGNATGAGKRTFDKTADGKLTGGKSRKKARGKKETQRSVIQEDPDLVAFKTGLISGGPDSFHLIDVGAVDDPPNDTEVAFSNDLKDFVDYIQYLSPNEELSTEDRAQEQIVRYAVHGPSAESQQWHESYIEKIKQACEKLNGPTGAYAVQRAKYTRMLGEWKARTLSPPPVGMPYKKGERYCDDLACTGQCVQERANEAAELQHKEHPKHSQWAEHGCEIGHLKGGPLCHRPKVYACIRRGNLFFLVGKLTSSNLFYTDLVQSSDVAAPENIAPNADFPYLGTTRPELEKIQNELHRKGCLPNLAAFDEFVNSIKNLGTLLDYRNFIVKTLQLTFPFDADTLEPGKAVAMLSDRLEVQAQLPLAISFGESRLHSVTVRGGQLEVASNRIGHSEDLEVASDEIGGSGDLEVASDEIGDAGELEVASDEIGDAWDLEVASDRIGDAGDGDVDML